MSEFKYPECAQGLHGVHEIYEQGTWVHNALFSLSGAILCQKTNFLRALSMCCRYVRQVCLTCLRAKLGTFEPWPGLQGPNSLKFMIIDIGIDIHWEIWRMAKFVG